jgi:N-acetylneuraminic acid mutarotase
LPNDLWEFNPSINQWAWMGGDNNFGGNAAYGTYGELGKFAPGNVPGSRWEGATWTDTSGNFWLFGGQGNASIVTEGILNDLWEFNPSTNQWAWMGGSSTLNCANVPQVYCNRPGVYGTLGVPAAGNIPGSRMDSFNWRDVNGNLWLFGGQGFDSNSNWNTLNDLWKFNPSTNQWAWMGAGSARLPMFRLAQGYTAHSGLLLQATSQGAGRRVSVGQTRRGISGFGAVRGSMRTSLMAI